MKVTMVSTGDGPVGASKLTGEVNIYKTFSIRQDFYPVFEVLRNVQNPHNHHRRNIQHNRALEIY